MSLSDDDRQRILDEERARVEARERAEAEAKRKKQRNGCLGCLGIVVGVPVVLAFLGGVMEGINGDKKGGTHQQAAKPVEPGKADDGENIVEVTLGKRKVKAALVDDTLHIVERLEHRKTIGNEFSSTKADGEFLIVHLIVRNDSKKTRTIGASQMSIIDAAGREFRTSSEGGSALTMSGDKTAEFLMTEVQPGLQKNISIVFDVPPGDKGLKLKVPSGGFGSSAVLPL